MADKIEIKLSGAADERDPRAPAWQTDLRDFNRGLLRAGLHYSQRAMAFDSVDVAGYPLPVFMAAVAPYAHDAIASVTILFEAWIKGRPGRKVKIKDGEFEIEVDRVEDLPKVAAFLADQRRIGEG